MKETRFGRASGMSLCLVALLFTLLLTNDRGATPARSARKAQPLPAVVRKSAVRLEVTQDTVAPPVRLLVPSINLSAAIEPVGILASGDLATPANDPWENVGWYSAGPRPGKPGSAVIDGHLDRPGGYPAVFWRLRFLRAGDSVLVIGANGKMLLFHVMGVAYYAPGAAPIQEIFGRGGGTYLNLITCAGDWIPSQHQTTLRLVVYTTLAG